MGKSYNFLTVDMHSNMARGIEAMQQKAQKKALAKAMKETQWFDYDKTLSKKASRKEEAERKRLETIRRKQENKKAYEEAMEKAAAVKKADRMPAEPEQKVTLAMLRARREAEQRAKEEEARKAEEAKLLPAVPVIPEPEKDEIEENLNREFEVLEARKAEEAKLLPAVPVIPEPEEDEIEENLNREFEVLVKCDDDESDDDDDSEDEVQENVYANPEKRIESLYTAFETIRIAQLKAEYPKLRLYKLKEMEEAERKRLETIRRKQENKKAYEEAMEKAAAVKKADRMPAEPEQKVTLAMLRARREAEQRAKEEEARKAEEAKLLPAVPVIPEPEERD
uniref:Coiled-coil domain-containing protein n=1 Tax=Panagrellus redivivus TaxID=6233 RepID=A0A7E4W0S1_PANRE